jgi:hypothetical protein
VLHLAQVGREQLWRLTVGVDWIELRDENFWIVLQFLPADFFEVRSGATSSEEAIQEHRLDSYARALELVEQLAKRP